jgi:hypothetical protein
MTVTARLTYKTLVARYLESAATTHGYTRQRLAEELGLKKGNYISMLVSPDYPTTLLSPCRIPALARLCGLSATERLELLHRRVEDHPDNPLQLNREVFRLLLASTVEAVDAIRKAKSSSASSAGAAHGC